MEARNRFLPDWMSRIRTHQIELPRFQRMESWGHKEVSDLLNSVARGLPVGSVLILEIGDEMPFVSRPLKGAPTTSERVTELLLDGQQRLTAVWRALHNDYIDRTYFAEIPEDEQDPAVIVSYARWERDGKRYPVWADNAKQCWDRRLVPVSVLRPGDDGEAELDRWIVEAVDDDPVADKQLSRRIGRLRQQFASFNIPFLSLGVATPKEVALEVFIKMNTSLMRLTTFDIIVAQTEGATGESLHDLMEGLASTVPDLREYDKPEDIVLNTMALLQDRVPSQSGYLGLDLDRMIDDWPILVESAGKAITFLSEESIFDDSRLPTDPVLAPIIACWSLIEDRPDAIGNAKILLRKYLWRAFFSDRYERATATASLQDYRALRDVLKGAEPESSIPIFDNQEYPLATLEAVRAAKWPKRRDRLARAVLQLSFLGGAEDIADGTPISRAHLKQREYHHLFPLAYLSSLGIEEARADSALNCALISWKTNRAISAKEPLRYLTERSDASSLGADEIARRLKTHGIDYSWMANGDYESFLWNRAEIAFEGMNALAQGHPWKPNL